MQRIEDSCYWLATRADRAARPALAGEQRARVAVVGAGFTGLWAAHHLLSLDPSLDVAVVEQEVAGFGASGRNAGIVSACLDHTHALAVTHFGRAEAARLAAVGRANYQALAAFAADCGFVGAGQLHVALSDEHVEDGAHAVAVARELGLEGFRTLDAAETRRRLDSPLYRGAYHAPDAGTLDPVRLVEKLRRDVEARGARVFERSPVTRIQGATVETAAGRLTADRVVLATDAWSHHLFPALLHRYIPLYDYILVSEPLTGAQRAAIGWAGREGVTDGRAFFNYYRLTGDDRILWGTSEAAYLAPNRVDPGCDHSTFHEQSLHESFRRTFPQLAGLAFPYSWGGPIASTTRLTPFFGDLNDRRVHYALGYTGHGIGSTRLAGLILAHQVLGTTDPLLSLAMVTRKPFPMPPEPLRSPAIRAVTRSLRDLDEGRGKSVLLRVLDALGIGFSS